jgi:hypothetical protein
MRPMAIQLHDRVKITKGGDAVQGFYGSVVKCRPGVDCYVKIDDGRDAQSGGQLPPGPDFGPYSLVSGSEEVAPA